MQVSKFNEWAQLLASVGVLIGILLVLMEIRQNTDLARMEARSTRFVSWEELSRLEVETNIRELFAKSYESPDQLTSAEILKVDAYLVNIVSILQQGAAMQQAGLVDDQIASYEGPAAFYFSGRFARAWFDLNQSWIIGTTPELGVAIRREIESTPVQEKFEYLEELKSRL